MPGDVNSTDDVFVRDRLAGVTRRVSVGAGGQANGRSGGSAIFADGRFVAFESDASSLVPGHKSGVFDVFVRDLVAGVTRRVSVGAGGGQPRQRHLGDLRQWALGCVRVARYEPGAREYQQSRR